MIQRLIIRFGWVCLALSIIGIIAWSNRFPEGFIFAAGDVVQYFNQNYVERNFRYLWSNTVGEGGFSSISLYYPFYATLFNISDLFGFSPSQQSFLYMSFFWGGSYLSCLFGLSLISNRGFSLWSFKASLLSLIYALNPYTFYVFYFIWGYTPFLYLYLAVPILVIATIEFINEFNWRRSRYLLVVLFCAHLFSTISYGNLAFFISANLVLFSLAIFYWILVSNVSLSKFGTKIFELLVVELIAVGWAVFPQLPALFESSPLKSSAIFDYDTWIIWQRLSFWEILSLNPNAGTYGISHPFALASGIMISVIAIGVGCLLSGRSIEYRRWLAAFVVVLAIALIESKGKGLVPDDWAILAFKNPILGALRSNGKAFIFLPFLLLFMLISSMRSWSSRSSFCLMMGVSLACIFSINTILLGGLPAEFLGGASSGEQVCKNAKSCYLVHIPSEYTEAAAAIKEDGLNGKILSLPYSVINSPGWANYPKWKHIGVDPTAQLFSLPIVQMNMYHPFGWPYGKDWVVDEISESEFFSLVSSLGVSYFIFHKDISRDFSGPAARHLQSYKERGLIYTLYESNVVSIYRVANSYLRAAVTAHNDVDSGSPLEKINVVKVDPTKYIVTMTVDADVTSLALRETFSRQWRVYVLPTEQEGSAQRLGGPLPWLRSFFFPSLGEGVHGLYQGYGNQWELNAETICKDFFCAVDKNGKQTISLIIEYWPQRYMYLLLIITALVGLSILISFFRFLMRR